MLPSFIVEELKKREEDRRRKQEIQPTIELEIPWAPPSEPKKDEDSDRGVVTFEFF